MSLSKPGKLDIIEKDIEALENNVQDITTDIEILKNKNISSEFKCNTSFLWNKLSRLKNLNTGFVNIGFIGDSWTQGT